MDTKRKKHVFLISDGTGITVEAFASSLLSQFPNIEFQFHEYPYSDTPEKIHQLKNKIQINYELYNEKPLVFLTIVDAEAIPEIKATNAHVYDFFTPMLDSLENALKTKAVDKANIAHAPSNPKNYDQRISAINYALACDDGLGNQNYDKADVILIGVSRCGKTPSCLYMALQFGIYAANYPFTDAAIHSQNLPDNLQKYKNKLFGLTIQPERLHHIRTERRANSQYASKAQCEFEINEIELLYHHLKIPHLDSTLYSIEEISTRIMSIMNIRRRI